MGFVVLGIVDFTGSKSGLPMPSGCRPEYGRRTRNDRGNSVAPCRILSAIQSRGFVWMVPFILFSRGSGVGFSVLPDFSFLSTSMRGCAAALLGVVISRLVGSFYFEDDGIKAFYDRKRLIGS